MFQSYLEQSVISELSTEIVDFLLKISIVDSFTEALASIITGNSAVYSLIERTMDSGNFLEKKNDVYTLRYQMKSALRRKAVKELSKNDLHNYAVLAGGYYESCGEDNKALELYAKYNDSDRIRELLIRNSRKSPETGYFIEMRKYYLMLSDEDIRSNAYLMSAMSMLYSMLLDFDKSEYWYNELKAYKNRTTGSKQREAISLIAYLDVGLSSRGSVNILQLIKDCYTLLTEKSLSVPEFSVTSNLPSLMNGGKDFCDWSKHDREIAATAGNIVCSFLGKYGKGLANAALAESFYEKGGDPYEIISLISKAKLEAEAGGKTELIFAANATLIRQYISHGEMDNAKELLNSFEKTAQSEKLHRLFPNIEAMKCRMSLYSGDMEAVGQWMKNAPDESRMFNALERYRYLTKIRCYIAYENYDRAYALIETLRYYAERCDRKYINMELDILTSVILFRKGDEWESRFIKALEKICEYRFIPIISEEGAAVYELLNQCADSCSRNKKINREWFARVISETGRISEYSVMIAKELGYSEEQCENLRKIAILHDIGKIGIPDSVLNKPAKLTDEEYSIMKSHVIRGAEILRNFTMIENVADGALYHHERYDGRGYANGLKGEEIPLNARIIGIADAFDAMTANRVYRKKLDLDYVIGELKKGRGTQFDPKLVDIMLRLIENGTVDVEQIYGKKLSEEYANEI